MKKLLYLASLENPFLLPKKRSGGGIGTLEPILLDWLRERYDVDIFCPQDSEEYDPYTGHVIRGSFLSKEKIGRCNMVQRTKDLVPLLGDYDYVFCNDVRLNPQLLLSAPEKDLRKFRMINHVTKRDYYVSYAVSQYHLHWLMSQIGAKIAHIHAKLDEDLKKDLPNIVKNPYKIPGQPVGVFGDKFIHIDLLTTDSKVTEGALSCENIWVTCGRTVENKRLPFAYRCWEKAGVDGEIHIFAQSPGTRKSDMAELQDLASQDPRLVLHIDQPQHKLFEVLRRAKGFLFPSAYESMGLVGFESICCGTPVIYSNPNSSLFLDQVPGNVRVSGSASNWAKVIRSFNTTLEDKKRIRKQTLGKWTSERCKTNLFEFIEKT